MGPFGRTKTNSPGSFRNNFEGVLPLREAKTGAHARTPQLRELVQAHFVGEFPLNGTPVRWWDGLAWDVPRTLLFAKGFKQG